MGRQNIPFLDLLLTLGKFLPDMAFSIGIVVHLHLHISVHLHLNISFLKLTRRESYPFFLRRRYPLSLLIHYRDDVAISTHLRNDLTINFINQKTVQQCLGGSK